MCRHAFRCTLRPARHSSPDEIEVVLFRDRRYCGEIERISERVREHDRFRFWADGRRQTSTSTLAVARSTSTKTGMH